MDPPVFLRNGAEDAVPQHAPPDKREHPQCPARLSQAPLEVDEKALKAFVEFEQRMHQLASAAFSTCAAQEMGTRPRDFDAFVSVNIHRALVSALRKRRHVFNEKGNMYGIRFDVTLLTVNTHAAEKPGEIATPEASVLHKGTIRCLITFRLLWRVRLFKVDPRTGTWEERPIEDNNVFSLEQMGAKGFFETKRFGAVIDEIFADANDENLVPSPEPYTKFPDIGTMMQTITGRAAADIPVSRPSGQQHTADVFRISTYEFSVPVPSGSCVCPSSWQWKGALQAVAFRSLRRRDIIRPPSIAVDNRLFREPDPLQGDDLELGETDESLVALVHATAKSSLGADMVRPRTKRPQRSRVYGGRVPSCEQWNLLFSRAQAIAQRQPGTALTLLPSLEVDDPSRRAVRSDFVTGASAGHGWARHGGPSRVLFHGTHYVLPGTDVTMPNLESIKVNKFGRGGCLAVLSMYSRRPGGAFGGTNLQLRVTNGYELEITLWRAYVKCSLAQFMLAFGLRSGLRKLIVGDIEDVQDPQEAALRRRVALHVENAVLLNYPIADRGEAEESAQRLLDGDVTWWSEEDLRNGAPGRIALMGLYAQVLKHTTANVVRTTNKVIHTEASRDVRASMKAVAAAAERGPYTTQAFHHAMEWAREVLPHIKSEVEGRGQSGTRLARTAQWMGRAIYRMYAALEGNGKGTDHYAMENRVVRGLGDSFTEIVYRQLSYLIDGIKFPQKLAEVKRCIASHTAPSGRFREQVRTSVSNFVLRGEQVGFRSDIKGAECAPAYGPLDAHWDMCVRRATARSGHSNMDARTRTSIHHGLTDTSENQTTIGLTRGQSACTTRTFFTFPGVPELVQRRLRERLGDAFSDHERPGHVMVSVGSTVVGHVPDGAVVEEEVRRIRQTRFAYARETRAQLLGRVLVEVLDERQRVRASPSPTTDPIALTDLRARIVPCERGACMLATLSVYYDAEKRAMVVRSHAGRLTAPMLPVHTYRMDDDGTVKDLGANPKWVKRAAPVWYREWVPHARALKRALRAKPGGLPVYVGDVQLGVSADPEDVRSRVGSRGEVRVGEDRIEVRFAVKSMYVRHPALNAYKMADYVRSAKPEVFTNLGWGIRRAMQRYPGPIGGHAKVRVRVRVRERATGRTVHRVLFRALPVPDVAGARVWLAAALGCRVAGSDRAWTLEPIRRDEAGAVLEEEAFAKAVGWLAPERSGTDRAIHVGQQTIFVPKTEVGGVIRRARQELSVRALWQPRAQRWSLWPSAMREPYYAFCRVRVRLSDLVAAGDVDFVDDADAQRAFLAFDAGALMKRQGKYSWPVDAYTHYRPPVQIRSLREGLVPYAMRTHSSRLQFKTCMDNRALGPVSGSRGMATSGHAVPSSRSGSHPLAVGPTWRTMGLERLAYGRVMRMALYSHPVTIEDAVVLNRRAADPVPRVQVVRERGTVADKDSGGTKFWRTDVPESLLVGGRVHTLEHRGTWMKRAEDLYDDALVRQVRRSGTKAYWGHAEYGPYVVREGQHVRGGDYVVLGCCMYPQVEAMHESQLLFSPVVVPDGVEGVVDSVRIVKRQTMVTGDNWLQREVVQDVEVRVVEPCAANVGDKFTTRHGQKVVCAMLMRCALMPCTWDGSPVDAGFNGHAVHTRETFSQEAEMWAGNHVLGETRRRPGPGWGLPDRAALARGVGEAVAAGASDAGAMLADLHQRRGFQIVADADAGRGPGPRGVPAYMESMKQFGAMDGRTGDLIEAGLAVSPSFLQPVDHRAKDKCQYRTTDTVRSRRDLITGQSGRGRRVDGGRKMGAMEQAALQASGAIDVQRQLNLAHAAGAVVPVCARCGAFVEEYSSVAVEGSVRRLQAHDQVGGVSDPRRRYREDAATATFMCPSCPPVHGMQARVNAVMLPQVTRSMASMYGAVGAPVRLLTRREQ